MYTISSSLSSSPENFFLLVTSLHNVWSSLKIRGHAYANPSLEDFNPFITGARYVSGLESVEVLELIRQIYDIDFSESQVVGMDIGLDSEELLDPGVKEAYRWKRYLLSRIDLEAKKHATQNLSGGGGPNDDMNDWDVVNSYLASSQDSDDYDEQLS
uniref:Uncharacterized protein n=1 Tax=Moniliophthora roreri TaxID=221103 RepID=A0A0W0FCV0_MONRR